jgi:hypothetical protein
MSNDESITADMLNDVRWEIPLVIEEIGAIAGFLREAINDVNEHGNIKGAAMVTSDALEAFANLEARLNDMAANVAKWTAAAEGEDAIDDDDDCPCPKADYHERLLDRADYLRDERKDREMEERRENSQ